MICSTLRWARQPAGQEGPEPCARPAARAPRAPSAGARSPRRLRAPPSRSAGSTWKAGSRRASLFSGPSVLPSRSRFRRRTAAGPGRPYGRLTQAESRAARLRGADWRSRCSHTPRTWPSGWARRASTTSSRTGSTAALIVARRSACASRAGSRCREERAAWLVMGAGLSAWAAGEISWTLLVANDPNPPYPSRRGRPLPGLLSGQLRGPAPARALAHRLVPQQPLARRRRSRPRPSPR